MDYNTKSNNVADNARQMLRVAYTPKDVECMTDGEATRLARRMLEAEAIARQRSQGLIFELGAGVVQ